MPKISVLVPLYNTKPAFFKAMVDSVLTQTVTEFELLLLNDSPENKELDALATTYCKKDKRIQYAKNTSNFGISKSRNILLDMAKGDYIAILDHDDLPMADRFKKQAEFLDKHLDIGVVGSLVRIVGSNKILSFPEDNLEIKQKMMQQCAICHSAAMIRRSVLIENNVRWNEAYSPAEDYMLWTDLMGCTMFHNLPEVLHQWRVYDESSGARQREKMADAAMRVRSILQNRFAAFAKHTRWIRLFGCLPLLKIYERGYGDTRVLLFGRIPLLRIH